MFIHGKVMQLKVAFRINCQPNKQRIIDNSKTNKKCWLWHFWGFDICTLWHQRSNPLSDL